MALDLSKLAALELPKKEIEVNILGDVQKVTIQALDDENALKVLSASADGEITDAEKQIFIRRLVLEKCLIPELSEQDISCLMTRAANSVADIYIAASELTKAFAKTRQKTAEEAKKNLNKTAETVTAD